MKIISKFTPPSPPILTDGMFTNNGRKIILNFDSATNQGAAVITNVNQIFKCSLLFSFTGASVSSCLWTTSRQVVITLGNSKSLIGLGDSIICLLIQSKRFVQVE